MKEIETLDPKMQPLISQLLMGAEIATGVTWVITSGRRTMKEQESLYAQGRTKKGNIVTNAKPGQSAHNFGMAADLAPLKDGKIWWNAPDSIWKQMADIAKQIGLVSGYYFKSIHDAPHVEHPDWKLVQAAWRRGEVVIV